MFMKLMTCNALNYLNEPNISVFNDGWVYIMVNFYVRYVIFVQYRIVVFE